MKNEVVYNMPSEAFYQAGGLSKSSLWLMYKKSPMHFKCAQIQKKTPALDIGRALHCAVLEPELFEKQYIRGPIDRRGNKWIEAKEIADKENKTLLVDNDYEEVLRMMDATFKNPYFSRYIMGKTSSEVSLFWQDEFSGIQCKARLDSFNQDTGVILELKTSHNASPQMFKKEVIERGYNVQEVMYSSGARSAGLNAADFMFFVIEKEPPYATAVYRLSDELYSSGKKIYDEMLMRYKLCLQNQSWPSYGNDEPMIII